MKNLMCNPFLMASSRKQSFMRNVREPLKNPELFGLRLWKFLILVSRFFDRFRANEVVQDLPDWRLALRVWSPVKAGKAQWLFRCAGLVLTTIMPLAHASEDHSHHHGPAAEQTSVALPLPLRATNEEAGHALSTRTPAATPAPTPEALAAAFPDLGGMSMADHMGSRLFWKVMLDRLEIQRHDSETTQAWKGGLWWGNDINRLVVSSEGERERGVMHSETRLYWRHAQSRWWDTTLGLRHDEGDGPARQWLTAGVQGMLPFFVETEMTLRVGEGGHTALHLELENDIRLTNRLILQPEMAMDVQGRQDTARGVGSGLAQLGVGLRLRYEIRRELAPYFGVEWQRALGDTADLQRAAGEPVGRHALVAGVRLWY